MTLIIRPLSFHLFFFFLFGFKMMKVSCMVFLTFTLVLSHQDVSKRGGVGSKRGLQEVTPKSTNQALTNLMTAGKDIPSGVIVSHSCEWREMRPLFRHKLGGYVCKFNGETTCYATGTIAKEVMLYSKNYEQENVPAGSEQFIGHYHEPIITWPLRWGGRWQFITKGEITGKTTEFSV